MAYTCATRFDHSKRAGQLNVMASNKINHSCSQGTSCI